MLLHDLQIIGGIYTITECENELSIINFHFDPSDDTVSVETIIEMSLDGSGRERSY
jgi:hypothetical protein